AAVAFGTHWADEAADRILGTAPGSAAVADGAAADDAAAGAVTGAPRPGPHRISTGISPSGPIHVGNLRETLTGDAIARVLRERLTTSAGSGLSKEVRLEFVADDFDPLRRVYPFLDA